MFATCLSAWRHSSSAVSRPNSLSWNPVVVLGRGTRRVASGEERAGGRVRGAGRGRLRGRRSHRAQEVPRDRQGSRPSRHSGTVPALLFSNWFSGLLIFVRIRDILTDSYLWLTDPDGDPTPDSFCQWPSRCHLFFIKFLCLFLETVKGRARLGIQVPCRSYFFIIYFPDFLFWFCHLKEC